MIRLLPYYEAFKFWPGMTPKSLEAMLMQTWNLNFTSTLQETQTGPIIPSDEILLDEREYYLSVQSDNIFAMPGYRYKSRYV